MLERIEEIQGIGLFHDANGKSYKWERATLFYGDNGRGKSTLATVLQSVATGDGTLLTNRKTIDGSLPSKVILQFSNGHKVTFNGQVWSESRPELLVFDSDFVEKNVHSGGVVNTGHRKNLLQFALGEKAVNARLAEEKASEKARKAAEDVKALELQLSGYHEGLLLSDFEKLENIQNIDDQIVNLDKRIAASQNSESILKIQVPTTIPLPELELGSIYSVLRTTIENIQDDSEVIVKNHLKKLAKPGAENWLGQGQTFHREDTCPFCDQNTSGIEIIQAYRTYFNTAYSALKSKVNDLDKSLSTIVRDSFVNDFYNQLVIASSLANAWIEHVSLPILQFDKEIALAKLKEIRTSVQELVEKKKSSPTSSCYDQGSIDRIKGLWKEILDKMVAVNVLLANARRTILDFRDQLVSENIQSLSALKKTLLLTKKRHDPKIVKLIESLSMAREEERKAEATKSSVRNKLNKLMKQTLDEYQESINALLTKFGPSLSDWQVE